MSKHMDDAYFFHHSGSHLHCGAHARPRMRRKCAQNSGAIISEQLRIYSIKIGAILRELFKEACEGGMS